MVWRSGCPRLYWAKIFLTDCKFLYELQIDYFNKSGCGLSLSHLTPNICVRVKLLLASKRAQLIQRSVDMLIPEAQRGKHNNAFCIKCAQRIQLAVENCVSLQFELKWSLFPN